MSVRIYQLHATSQAAYVSKYISSIIESPYPSIEEAILVSVLSILCGLSVN
jgi:hypothetical protein